MTRKQRLASRLIVAWKFNPNAWSTLRGIRFHLARFCFHVGSHLYFQISFLFLQFVIISVLIRFRRVLPLGQQSGRFPGKSVVAFSHSIARRPAAEENKQQRTQHPKLDRSSKRWLVLNNTHAHSNKYRACLVLLFVLSIFGNRLEGGWTGDAELLSSRMQEPSARIFSCTHTHYIRYEEGGPPSIIASKEGKDQSSFLRKKIQRVP